MDDTLDTPYNPTAARIMVVDDEAANLKLLSLMLRAEGYHQVDLVQDPREVLATYRQARPDLILLDISMPHLDGYMVMDQLKALVDPLAPPIVVLSAHSGEDFLVRALQGGASDFLSKPFNRRELLARVHNILLAQLAQRLLRGQHDTLECLVRERTKQLQQSRLDIVRRLGRAAELRDSETGEHILRMSHSAALLAHHLGWSKAECELLLHASPMHDIGKIGIPDSILLKPGPLAPQERAVMNTHTTIGAGILSGTSNELLEMAHDIALSHHERWDGSGYPHGLAGDAIPQAARIVAIADVFDALTSVRPYKQAWPVGQAVKYLSENAGTHFDASMVPVFVSLIPDVLRIRERFAEPVMPVETELAELR